MAVAAPPAPRTTSFCPRTSTPCSRRLRTKPMPSVLWPVSIPSSPTVTVLQAPMSLAAGDSSSTIPATAVLSGMVTLKPPTPRVFRAATPSAVRSRGMSKAR